MRTIKFRGKSKKTGKWLYGYLTEYEIGHMAICPASCYTLEYLKDHEVDPDTVGEYTGFYTKDGNDIYEGDIIKYDDNDGSNDRHYIEVIYLRGTPTGYYFDPDHDARMQVPLAEIIVASVSHYIIICNIHDNPKILANKILTH